MDRLSRCMHRLKGQSKHFAKFSSTLLSCPVVTRTACHAARDYYVQHHVKRYVDILGNQEYMDALKLTADDVAHEIQTLKQRSEVLQKSNDKHKCAVQLRLD